MRFVILFYFVRPLPFHVLLFLSVERFYKETMGINFFSLGMTSLCSAGWPGTPYVDEIGLKVIAIWN